MPTRAGIAAAQKTLGPLPRLVMADMDIRTVAELMGHKRIQMTMRYAHFAPEHKLVAVERLARYNPWNLKKVVRCRCLRARRGDDDQMSNRHENRHRENDSFVSY